MCTNGLLSNTDGVFAPYKSSPRTSGSRHHPQRAASQAVFVLVSGLLSSMADAPVFGPRCAGRSMGTVSRTRPNCRISSRPGTPSLSSSKGCMSIRDGQLSRTGEYYVASRNWRRSLKACNSLTEERSNNQISSPLDFISIHQI